MGTGYPGSPADSSGVNSGWRDEITTISSVPVDITFVVSLHVDWNDGRVWAFQMADPKAATAISVTRRWKGRPGPTATWR
ncbi:MAG: hypothetical protein H7Z19_12975 [Chitinophagaceae bacterium]|nr:hypothetical protein [Rubrivivax sp.]